MPPPPRPRDRPSAGEASTRSLTGPGASCVAPAGLLPFLPLITLSYLCGVRVGRLRVRRVDRHRGQDQPRRRRPLRVLRGHCGHRRRSGGRGGLHLLEEDVLHGKLHLSRSPCSNLTPFSSLSPFLFPPLSEFVRLGNFSPFIPIRASLLPEKLFPFSLLPSPPALLSGAHFSPLSSCNRGFVKVPSELSPSPPPRSDDRSLVRCLFSPRVEFEASTVAAAAVSMFPICVSKALPSTSSESTRGREADGGTDGRRPIVFSPFFKARTASQGAAARSSVRPSVRPIARE